MHTINLVTVSQVRPHGTGISISTAFLAGAPLVVGVVLAMSAVMLHIAKWLTVIFRARAAAERAIESSTTIAREGQMAIITRLLHSSLGAESWKCYLILNFV